MSQYDQIKQRILAMPECDKNGLILAIIEEAMYPNELIGAGATEWSADTADRISLILSRYNLVPEFDEDTD